MAYFKQNEKNQETAYVPSFQPKEEEYDDNFDELSDEDLYDPDEDPAERIARRKDRIRFFFGMADFAGVIVGTVVILLLAALLFSLIRWLSTDISQNFALWQNKL